MFGILFTDVCRDKMEQGETMKEYWWGTLGKKIRLKGICRKRNERKQKNKAEWKTNEKEQHRVFQPLIPTVVLSNLLSLYVVNPHRSTIKLIITIRGPPP